MTKPIASLSLDLDNKWAYLRTHGVAGWEKYPSYFDVVVPRVLRFLTDRGLRTTCFVVGRDAEQPENHDALSALAEAGHEIGNHSLNHYPWMNTLPLADVEFEIRAAEESIETATGRLPVGFRGPGYSLPVTALCVLAARGYEYDASTLPTYIGPLARWYFHRTATADASDEADRRVLFGSWRDGLRPNKPFVCETESGPIVEIPVTTFPWLKLPIHVTYLLYLWQFSPWLARRYVRSALRTCRLLGIGPSVLFHPLDFLGAEDDPDLRFFPGMNLPREEKLVLLDNLLARLSGLFRMTTIREQAAAVRRQFGIAAAPVLRIPHMAEPLVAASEAI